MGKQIWVDGQFVLFRLLVGKMMVDEINERRRKDGGNQEMPWVRKEEGP